jgi:hypothetical protein
MNRASLALTFFASCVFVALPPVASAQRGGGASSGGNASRSVGEHSTSSRVGSGSTGSSSSHESAPDHPGIVVVSGRSDIGERSVPTSSERARSDQWLGNDSANRQSSQMTTIGFPRPIEESNSVSLTASEGTRFVDEGIEIREEQEQRGYRPVAPQRSQAPTAPVVSAPALPRTAAATHPVFIRPLHRIQNRPALWFLAPRLMTDDSRFSRRRFRGGFGLGFFGFGLPLGFGFGPDCNPFWAEPWAFGCDTFGYFDGFGASLYQPQPPETTEESIEEQEPEQNVYIPPPPASSPEEIQAEKILFVLYMKNGAVYALTNYWIADGKLHYVTSYGGENTIEMSELDLQKTVDVNAKRGVDFTLKPRPDQDQHNAPQQ